MTDFTQIQNDIIQKFSFYCFSIEQKNKLGLTDENRQAQDFFTQLGNELWGYNLINSDYLNENQDVFDLCDEQRGLLIQVTSKSDGEKIKRTLEGFKDKYSHKYGKIKIWIIGNKKNNRINYSPYNKFFDKDQDIIDLKSIITEIKKIYDYGKLGNIASIVNKYQKLNWQPLRFNDIKKTLDYLKDYLLKENKYSTCNILNIDNNRVTANDKYINEKNKLNGVSDKLYKKDIIYLNILVDFLNFDTEYRREYNSISYSINNILKHKTLYDVLKEIRASTSIENEEDRLNLKIVLDNMYFSCDIGKKPNDFLR